MNIRNLALTGVVLGVVAASLAAQSPWTTLPSPNPIVFNNQLYGVGGSGPNYVWAVGGYVDQSVGFETLALHWDGAQWTQVLTPAPFSDFVSVCPIKGPLATTELRSSRSTSSHASPMGLSPVSGMSGVLARRLPPQTFASLGGLG